MDDSDSYSLLSDVTQATSSISKTSSSSHSESSTNCCENLLSSAKDELHQWLMILEKEYCINDEGKLVKKMESHQQDDFIDVNGSFLEIIGKIFEALSNIIKLTLSSIGNEKISAVCFVGTTGSGKSTLVQVLGADNNKIYSKEVSPDHFIIADQSKIGNSTVVSQTLYPELMLDNLLSQYFFCDTPGFEENRSSMHELVAMNVMQKLLQHLDKLKIVLVCPQASLVKGGNRNEFINILKNITCFISDVKKFRNSFYLVGSKVENSITRKNGKIEITSDEAVIDSIVLFLNEIKSTFCDPNFCENMLLEKHFYDNCLLIIDSLLEQNDSKRYNRINILRRPLEEGPLSNITELQSERVVIREMLLNDKDFVSVNENDFCITLADTTLRFLHCLFEEINTYVKDVSKAVSNNIVNHFKIKIENVLNFNEAYQILMTFKESIKTLSSCVEKCENPNEYYYLMKKFSEDNNCFVQELFRVEKVLFIFEFLTDLEKKTHSIKFCPFSWSAPLKLVTEFIDANVVKCNFLKETYFKLSSYGIQKERLSLLFGSKLQCHDIEVNQVNLMNFLKKIHLQEKCSLIKIEHVLKELRSIVNLTLEHKFNFFNWDEETLVVTDYFVVLSDLFTQFFTKYPSVNTLIIFAMHTVYIDYNLTDDWFKGKSITIISPVWKIWGSREINVDGVSHKPLRKAGMGAIGRDGSDGKPGGSFLGIGMVFEGTQCLKISACGGAGQDGQDGGDGENGADGTDANNLENEEVEESSGLMLVVYNRFVKKLKHKGTPGQPGGNSGEGGKGGKGGKKGTVNLYAIGDEKHGITVIKKDGKQGKDGVDGTPGEGGRNGKSVSAEKATHLLVFIPVHLSYSAKDVQNSSSDRASRGEIIRKIRTEAKVFNDNDNTNNQSDDLNDLIPTIECFVDHYEKHYKSFVNDGRTEIFIDVARKYISERS